MEALYPGLAPTDMHWHHPCVAPIMDTLKTWPRLVLVVRTGAGGTREVCATCEELVLWTPHPVEDVDNRPLYDEWHWNKLEQAAGLSPVGPGMYREHKEVALCLKRKFMRTPDGAAEGNMVAMFVAADDADVLHAATVVDARPAD